MLAVHIMTHHRILILAFRFNDVKECADKGLKGTIVDNPLDPKPVQTDCCHTPSSLKVFAEQLWSEIRNPWLEKAALQTEGEDSFSIQYEVISVDE